VTTTTAYENYRWADKVFLGEVVQYVRDAQQGEWPYGFRFVR
jgi:hypothetical protein